MKCTHLALQVRDTARSVAFYSRYCAMRVVHQRLGAEGGTITWLGWGEDPPQFVIHRPYRGRLRVEPPAEVAAHRHGRGHARGSRRTAPPRARGRLVQCLASDRWRADRGLLLRRARSGWEPRRVFLRSAHRRVMIEGRHKGAVLTTSRGLQSSSSRRYGLVTCRFRLGRFLWRVGCAREHPGAHSRTATTAALRDRDR